METSRVLDVVLELQQYLIKLAVKHPKDKNTVH